MPPTGRLQWRFTEDNRVNSWDFRIAETIVAGGLTAVASLHRSHAQVAHQLRSDHHQVAVPRTSTNNIASSTWVDVPDRKKPSGNYQTTKYTVPGLTNGTEHTFQVRAVASSTNRNYTRRVRPRPRRRNPRRRRLEPRPLQQLVDPLPRYRRMDPSRSYTFHVRPVINGVRLNPTASPATTLSGRVIFVPPSPSHSPG